MSQEIFVILFMGYACTNARGFPMESLERATKFRVRLGRDAQHQSQTEGAFFWDYSGIGILGIDGICVLFGATVFRFRDEWNLIPFNLLPIGE